MERKEFAARSGDDHLIGDDGALVNLDQQRRDAAAKDAQAAQAAPTQKAKPGKLSEESLPGASEEKQ